MKPASVKRAGPPASGFSERAIRFIQQYRIRLSFAAFAPFIIAGLLGGFELHAPTESRDPWVLLGWALVLFGTGLRSWAAGCIDKERSLSTNGPYALTRHPLYSGSLLLAVGLCPVLGDFWLLIPLALVVILIYVPKIRQEERDLAARFGTAWREYCMRTAEFFPRRIPCLRAGFSWRLWVHNQEYYAAGSVLTVLVIAVFIHVRA